MIYRDEELPPRDPELKINYTFFDDMHSRLYWKRDDEDGFCERFAQYVYQNEILSEKIIWVNPENDPSCSRDPDMQLGNHTQTPLKIKNDELYLYLKLSDEYLIYVWKRI